MTRLLWVSLAAAGIVAMGATPEQVRQKRAEYLTACKDARAADPQLEWDLTASPLEALAARVEAARKRAEACWTARSEYLSSAAGVAAPKVGAGAEGFAGELRAAITRQQANLVAAIKEVNRQVESLSPRGESALVREAAQRRRTALLSIQNTLVEQSLALDEMKDNGTGSPDGGSAAASLFAQLGAGYPGRPSPQPELELSRQYYSALGDIVSKRRVATEAAAAAKVTPEPVSAAADATVRPEWLGTYAYSAAHPIFAGDEPVSVEVRIGQQNTIVVGSYTARYRLKAGDQRNPLVKFEFAGPLQPGPAQRFDITGGGSIEVLKGPVEQSLELVWKRPAAGNTIVSNNVLVTRK